VGLLDWDPRIWKSGMRAEIGDGVEIELGWTLSRHAWGHGYATEAAIAARDWTLRETRPRRLISLIHPNNERSKRVAGKIGERFDRLVTTHRGIAAEVWSL
jgi:RimJ/RimL family protein N-acetyltransferase